MSEERFVSRSFLGNGAAEFLPLVAYGSFVNQRRQADGENQILCDRYIPRAEGTVPVSSKPIV
jgi:hypothetical protein